jgi:hypothetical protein
MAHRIADKFRDRGEVLDDLQQIAALALVKAVERYDRTGLSYCRRSPQFPHVRPDKRSQSVIDECWVAAGIQERLVGTVRGRT